MILSDKSIAKDLAAAAKVCKFIRLLNFLKRATAILSMIYISYRVLGRIFFEPAEQ
ncbi:MAG: hypothetical protein LUG85_08295 [Clostridiales bacterium]|nr:hypothetical protein [Clostridiales bacterium]MCD7828511.1 hypothetical protein [Clostridiales bacterium]